MKRFGMGILLTIYLAFTSGIVVNIHYCMGRFDSVQLGSQAAEICGKCGMHSTESNGCCHDEVQIYKLADDQKISGPIQFQFFPELTPLPVQSFSEAFLVSSENNRLYRPQGPPLHKQDTYLRNNVFRI